ncbi:hypothetical protein MMC30_001417 [Trapelia coarctata]|nr:hypothetical protein [Trapelia coarctata]
MASTSAEAGYTRIPRTSEGNERKGQNVDTRSKSSSLGLPLNALLRLAATAFSLTAIITIIIGDIQRWGRSPSKSNGAVAFPLVFLFLSFLSHFLATILYFSSMVHVEWKGPNWEGPRQRSYGRSEPAKRPPVWLTRAADLAVGTLMVVGISVSSAVTYWLVNVAIVGIVFTSLTAATHILLGVVRTDRYRLTLLYSPDTDGETQERVKSPLSYHDLEDTTEHQPIISTLEV